MQRRLNASVASSVANLVKVHVQFVNLINKLIICHLITGIMIYIQPNCLEHYLTVYKKKNHVIGKGNNYLGVKGKCSRLLICLCIKGNGGFTTQRDLG